MCMRGGIILLLGGILISGCTAAGANSKKSGATPTMQKTQTENVDTQPSVAGAALHRLFDAEWDYWMEQNPVRASTLGDRRWNDRWTDESLDAIEKRHEHNVGVLAKLQQVDRGQLSLADQLKYDLFEKNYKTSVEEFKFHYYLMPISQM